MNRLRLAVGAADRAHELVLALAAELGGGRPWLAHACPECGSATHGRPVVLGTDRPVWVSLARDRDHRIAAAVASCDAPTGVDVEATGAVEPAVAELARHPGSRLEAELPATILWTAKEAVLKVLGVGLQRDPSTLDLAGGEACWQRVDLGSDWTIVVASAQPITEVVLSPEAAARAAALAG